MLKAGFQRNRSFFVFPIYSKIFTENKSRKSPTTLAFKFQINVAVGFDTLVKKNASTADTLALIIKTINEYDDNIFVKRCAELLCPPGTSKLDCIRNVFDYYCRNVDYVTDPIFTNDKGEEVGIEIVNTPMLTISNGVGDCKKCSVFLMAVLKNVPGINPVLKHVEYAENVKWTHIYVIVPNPDLKHYITVDPTNDKQFNKEVDYDQGTLYFLDGKVMELRQMGRALPGKSDISMGCGDMLNDLNNISGVRYMGGASAVHSLPVGVQRASFLAMVRQNHGGLATALALTLGHQPDALDNDWRKFGGDIAELKQAVIEGSKIDTPMMKGPRYMDGPRYMGATPHEMLQANINYYMGNQWMRDSLAAGIKIGGAHGVPADTATTKQYVYNIAKADMHTLTGFTAEPTDAYTAYNYPGIEAYVNDSASTGTGREPAAPILKQIATTVASVAKYVPGVGPLIADTLNGLASSTEDSANSTNPNHLPGIVDSIPGAKDAAGSFYSPVGFAFKTIMLQMVYHPSAFWVAASSILATAVPLIYYSYKFYSKWRLTLKKL